MNPLPMAPLKHNECIPRCGECCSGLAPVSKEDGERLLDWIANLDASKFKKLAKQIRYWGGAASACPFLTSTASCFVYEARPHVCRAFGRVPTLPCPKGVTFDPMPAEATDRFYNVHTKGMIEDGRATLTWLIGSDLLKGLKNARDGAWHVTPLLYSTVELQQLIKEAQERSKTCSS